MKLFKRHLLDSLGALTDIDGLKTVSLHEVRWGNAPTLISRMAPMLLGINY